MKENPMRELKVAKVTLNIGTGKEQEMLEKALKLLEKITQRTPVKTLTKKKIPSWGLRPGLPIGCKVTLRKDYAVEVLKRVLAARDNKLGESCFDNRGNVSFGLKEYIDVPGVKYDPEIGIIGFNVCVTLERAGYRIKRRRIKKKRIPSCVTITRPDAINFMKSRFNVEIEESAR